MRRYPRPGAKAPKKIRPAAGPPHKEQSEPRLDLHAALPQKPLPAGRGIISHTKPRRHKEERKETIHMDEQDLRIGSKIHDPASCASCISMLNSARCFFSRCPLCAFLRVISTWRVFPLRENAKTITLA